MYSQRVSPMKMDPLTKPNYLVSQKKMFHSKKTQPIKRLSKKKLILFEFCKK